MILTYIKFNEIEKPNLMEKYLKRARNNSLRKTTFKAVSNKFALMTGH